MLILIYFKASNIDFVHNFYAIHLYWIRVQHSANPVNFWLDLIKGKAKLLQGLLFNEVIYLFHSHSLLAAAFWCINCINECRLYTSILVQLLWCNVLYLFILQRATFFLPNNEMFQKKMVQGFSSFSYIVVRSQYSSWTIWNYSSLPRWNSQYKSECAKLLGFNRKRLIQKKIENFEIHNETFTRNWNKH